MNREIKTRVETDETSSLCDSPNSWSAYKNIFKPPANRLLS